MKSLSITLISLIFFSALASGQSSQSDFRNFSWGSSFSDVQNGEKATFVNKDKDDLLVYSDQVAGSDCDVLYQFNDNNKLVNGSYIFTKKYTNPQLYIEDFNKFKNLLILKYGSPQLEKEDWATNISQRNKESFGQAISDGNLSLITAWTTPKTIVKITLVTINNKPSLQIHYTSKSLSEMENKEDLKKAMLKL